MTDTKKAPLLTIQKATSQARRHVDRLMPGVMATVDSRLSHDLATDTPLIITTVTFPEHHTNAVALMDALDVNLSGVRKLDAASASLTITRTR